MPRHRFFDIRPWPRLAALLLACACLLALGAARAETTPAAPLPDVTDLRTQLDRLPESAQGTDTLESLLARLAALGDGANKLIAARTGVLNDLNARLGELGTGPAPGGSEDADVTRQRQTLTRERNTVDADIRLARLVVVDAQQRANALRGQQRDLFETRITERTHSPLGRAFWRDLRAAWPADLQKLAPLVEELRAGLARAAEPGHRGPLLLALLVALLAVTAGDLLAERGLVRLAQRLLPGGRLRRSLLVLAIVLLNMGVVALAAQGLLQMLDAHGILGPLSSRLARSADDSLIFIAFVVSLGRALLANPRPSWRLPPISDTLARQLAPYPWLVALVALVVWAPTQVNLLVQASEAAVSATQILTALLLTALMAALLSRLRGQAAPVTAPAATDVAADPQAAPSAPVDARPPWLAMALGALALVLIAVLLLLVLGYAAFASLLAGQIVWTGLVGAAFYVLFKFVDDLCMALLSARGTLGRRLHEGFDFAPAALDQAAVVLSAVVRVALFFYLLLALAAPLGSGPSDVFARSGRLGTGFAIGEFQLVPAALFSALAVAVAGFVALRVFMRWMYERYLPTTSLEPGAQSSLGTLLNYAGAILVVAMAMSALGIGVNRIAWIASALSVGIGFGLQAIVQNFISGLILLAERPVKVGDWVVLGTTEGDIRRINVRATEILLGDRSTVIVPNSEFITKTVRNMTLSNAEGRVLIRLPMPLATDAAQVRELMLAACAAHPLVLPTPAPSLTLEGVENGMLVFQAICYVSGPRVAGGVRSDLLFAMLDAFRTAGVAMAAPPTVVVASPPPAPV